jgi:ATP-dependent helicase/nuclease subunit A
VELITADVVCPGQWVLLAALRRTEAGALFALGGRPGQTEPGEPAWEIRVAEAPQGGNSLPQEEATAQSLPAGEEERLRRGLMFQYGHESATRAPSKQTATQRKGRDKDAEAAENAPAPVRAHAWRKPGFAQYGGKDYGTAVHLAMQHIRYGECADREGVARELQRLTDAGFLTSEQAGAVPCDQIAAFFTTDIGQKLRNSDKVLREFKFSILDDGENYDPALQGEQILLQGVVDCALIEEDGITVVDFKTDRVTEETLPQRLAHYRPQVLAYASALERIYEKPVKASLLYFFRLGKFVPVK